MVCQACGKAVEGEARFCPHCGAQMTPPATPPIPPNYGSVGGYGLAPTGPRVQRHLQTLGTLWCVYGAYRVITGLIGLFFVRAFAWHRFGYDWPFGAWGMHHHGPPWPWMGFVPGIIGISVLIAALALFAGLSLLNRKPYGRVLAIVLAVLALFKFPLGTALGIYTLWVMAPATSALEYETLAEHT